MDEICLWAFKDSLSHTHLVISVWLVGVSNENTHHAPESLMNSKSPISQQTHMQTHPAPAVSEGEVCCYSDALLSKIWPEGASLLIVSAASILRSSLLFANELTGRKIILLCKHESLLLSAEHKGSNLVEWMSVLFYQQHIWICLVQDFLFL